MCATTTIPSGSGSAGVTSVTRPWNSSYLHTERERWICIYPAYINARKTRAEGRKLPASVCVDFPRYEEIRDALSASGLNVGMDNKVYPRERDVLDPRFKGRIRVQIKDENGKPIKPEYPDRISVMKLICQTIPKLKSRQGQQSSSAGITLDSTSAATAAKKSNKRKNKK